MAVKTRKRLKLVPDDCIEQYEVRLVRYWDKEGRCWNVVNICSPDSMAVFPDRIEVHGLLHEAHTLINEMYAEEDDDD